MKLGSWLSLRSPEYLVRKTRTLLRRYGVSEAKAVNRTMAFVTHLARHGGRPTLFVPGQVLQRYPGAIERLLEMGVEVGMHGWNHVDLHAYPLQEARAQLIQATQLFESRGIVVHGFRCPYLRYTDALVESLPEGMLSYSSNEGVWWEVVSSSDMETANAIFDATKTFYNPKMAGTIVSTPWQRSNMLEIPVSLPDDMLLYDGIYHTIEGMTAAWERILEQTYERGELFNLIFHPELADQEEGSFATLLDKARRWQPHIWVARLRDISAWWLEKAGFNAHIARAPAARSAVTVKGATEEGDARTGRGDSKIRGTIPQKDVAKGLHIAFECTDRATILLRSLPSAGGEPWSEGYHRWFGETLDLSGTSRPFVGLPDEVPAATLGFLRNQGYILDTEPETARRCGVIIDRTTLQKLQGAVDDVSSSCAERLPSASLHAALVDHIEASTAPLVKYGRWPDGARSALSFSGDLDALSLMDYATRLWTR